MAQVLLRAGGGHRPRTIRQHFIYLAWIFKAATLILLSTRSPIAAGQSSLVKLSDGNVATRESVEDSLVTIHDIATENLGTLCISKLFRPLQVPLNADRYESARQKADLTANVLQEVGITRHGGLLDALAKGLLSDDYTINARIIALNMTNSLVQSYVWWTKNDKESNAVGIGEHSRYEEDAMEIGKQPDFNYPWFDDGIASSADHSEKFVPNALNTHFKGFWTFPYYSCTQSKWLLSYSVSIPPLGRHGLRGFVSIDIDVSNLRVNQCEGASSRQSVFNIRSKRLRLSEFEVLEAPNDIESFHGSHKCHRRTMDCTYRLPNDQQQSMALTTNFKRSSNSWHRGAYQCVCKQGFYSTLYPEGYNGTIMEMAWRENQDNISDYYVDVFKCLPCAPGCGQCVGPEPCLAVYNWPFRITLLIVSVGCAVSMLVLSFYLFQYRKFKVFKAASPIFLLITLVGCAIMYLEMLAIFPILDTTWCIATKWTRHMGFCITYTSLLMKTWRVSLTYRVKSAHKVKLTDKQLLQWMVPILLVMLIYLGTWTISATPYAENIRDQDGMKFKQCSYNWWDHSLAIGEILFLAWGIRICYNVRNAESLYNEARLISYAIYNIAIVNITMVAFHILIFPQAGPDIKYLLGFVRTQLSTSVTIALVFGPKISRVLKGQGDQWDHKSRVRSITASFSLNGVGLVPEESPDLYQENEELKEEIQKLAHQIEFMKTVHMQMNNRHLKPKPGGYFTITSTSFQTPFAKSAVNSAQTQTGKNSQANSSCISEDGHSGNSLGTNSMCYPTAPMPTPTNRSESTADKV